MANGPKNQNTDFIVDDLLANPFGNEDPALEKAPEIQGKTNSDLFQQLSEERQQQAKALAAQIDENNMSAITSYGAQAQKDLGKFSHTLIEQVRSKETGDIGITLRELMQKLNESDPGELNPDSQNKILKWFKRQKQSIFETNAKYQQIGVQIDTIATQLDTQKNMLLNDNRQLEGLYKQNYQYFEAINVYIAAGQLKLADIQQQKLPEVLAKAQKTGDQMDLQSVADLEQFADRLEKRIYDLQLTRQMTIQQAPQIRLIQNTNQALAEKIQSSINTAIPLWKNQIAINLSLFKQKNAIDAQRAVSDTTNKLLTANADMLKQSSLEAARENERGVIDIETLQHTQQSLMETLEETFSIQEEGRAKRKAAEETMLALENEMRDKLLAFSERRNTSTK